MQNIEFKCELRDLTAARVQCQSLGARHVSTIRQIDTYFRLPDGRLKKREVEGDPVEWIFYHRQDRLTPKMSQFTLYTDQQARTRWGTVALKPWLAVRKKREIYLKENVRIHLDDVDVLGTFIEFEALVSPRFNVRVCHEEIAALRKAFGPILGETIAQSYSDLMDQQRRARTKNWSASSTPRPCGPGWPPPSRR